MAASFGELADEICDINISNDDNDAQNRTDKKFGFKNKKLESKLRKYESILKNSENINRTQKTSKFLFAGNCGLDNNVSRENLQCTFEKYGSILDIIMQTKKSYSFIVYEQEKSTDKAIEDLQGKIIEYCMCQPKNCYYLLPVDKVPNLCDLNSLESSIPNGLIYLENFVDDSYANEIINFIYNDQQAFTDLKNRRVKHYGYEFRYGLNDVDPTKPLEYPIPSCLNSLIDKCIDFNLISEKPDQLTVNLYEPGQGIPPHVDNINAFSDYIMSLSLLSSIVMDFRLKNEKMSSLWLKPNSLIIFKSDSRYKWSHSIAERKYDLISNKNGDLTINKRELRISLTFRKTIMNSKNDDNKIKLPENESEAYQFESTYVHNIYNQIAEHFSCTRHSPWPGVVKFIESLQPYSIMLDIGCGNGKYLNIRKDLISFGCDYSTELINICQKRNFNCFSSDCLNLSCNNNQFDSVICIAVLHHLSTKERRLKAIDEMLRVLKVGGKGLVTVWAKEQKLNETESYYIQKSKNKNKSVETCDDGKNENFIEKPSVHEFGKPFEKQDLFVTWHNQKAKNDNIYLRFYHVFNDGELENLFNTFENVKILEIYYEQGNWCIIFEKKF